MKNNAIVKAGIALVLSSVLHLTTFAQQEYRLSAKEAVDLALKQVIDLKNLQVDRKIQVAKNREIAGQALPQVSGTISATHYFSIPVTLLPDFISPSVYNVLVDEGVKNGSGTPIEQPSGPPALFPARFGVPWQASAGIAIQQLLFQPDVFVGLKARSTAIEFAENNIRVMEDSIRSNVYRAYYSVLIARKRRGILAESVTRLEKLLHDQTEMYKNGFAERLDLDKTQVSLNNLRTALTQVDNLMVLGDAALKFSTGLEQRDSLYLTDTLSVEQIKQDLLDMPFQYEDRNEVKLLNSLKKLHELDIKRYKLGRIPTFSAFYNFSENAQREKFNFFNFDEPWYRTSLAGFNVSVPIFSGLQRNRKIEQAELTLEKTNNSLTNLKRAIDLQQVSSLSALKNALSSLDVQVRNMELAERVYNSTKLKFEQGLGSSFEILQAETSLEDSQSNYFQALYEAVIARIGYMRALGKL
jgi:outer membrane protein